MNILFSLHPLTDIFLLALKTITHQTPPCWHSAQFNVKAGCLTWWKGEAVFDFWQMSEAWLHSHTVKNSQYHCLEFVCWHFWVTSPSFEQRNRYVCAYISIKVKHTAEQVLTISNIRQNTVNYRTDESGNEMKCTNKSSDEGLCLLLCLERKWKRWSERQIGGESRVELNGTWWDKVLHRTINCQTEITF